MRILLTEDNIALVDGLSAILRGTGHAVHDVLTVHPPIRSSPLKIDPVILDLNLPEMDGLDVLRAMRAPQNQAADAPSHPSHI